MNTKLTEAAIQYTIKYLLNTACPNLAGGSYTVSINSDENAEVSFERASLSFSIMASEKWDELFDGRLPMQHIETYDKKPQYRFISRGEVFPLLTLVTEQSPFTPI